MVFVVQNAFSDDDSLPRSLMDGLDAPIHADIEHYLSGTPQARHLPTTEMQINKKKNR